MKRFLLTIVLSLMAIAPAASANVKLAASPTESDLRGACTAAGGEFNLSPDGGGYACTTVNCDGKGGNCTVACDNDGNCRGQTPMILVNAMTLLGILQNGDMVFRSPQGSFSGGSLSSSGGDSAATPANQAEQEPPPPEIR